MGYLPRKGDSYLPPWAEKDAERKRQLQADKDASKLLQAKQRARSSVEALQVRLDALNASVQSLNVTMASIADSMRHAGSTSEQHAWNKQYERASKELGELQKQQRRVTSEISKIKIEAGI